MVEWDKAFQAYEERDYFISFGEKEKRTEEKRGGKENRDR